MFRAFLSSSSSPSYSFSQLSRGKGFDRKSDYKIPLRRNYYRESFFRYFLPTETRCARRAAVVASRATFLSRKNIGRRSLSPPPPAARPSARARSVKLIISLRSLGGWTLGMAKLLASWLKSLGLCSSTREPARG